MSWNDVGDAIVAAIELSSGLAGKVIWKDQDRNSPSLDYVSIQLAGITAIGIDYVDQTTFNPNAQPGQEFSLQIRGRREVTLEVECFTSLAVSSKQGAALELCERTKTGLKLPAAQVLLDAVGISVFDLGDTRWIPDVPSVSFRGRAVSTLRMYMPPPTQVEYAGYIARVSGAVDQEGGINGDVVFPFDTGPNEG
jgi:hypothetical protein